MLNHFLHLLESEPSAIASWLTTATMWGWGLLSVLARLTGLLMLSPIPAPRGVPVWFRVGLAACLALVVTPVIVGRGLVLLPADGWTAAAHLAGELTLGALLGFGVLFVFAGLRLAGELIDQQAGAAMQEILDPQTGGTTTPAGQLLTIVGTLALLCATPGDGYLRILSVLFDTFQGVSVDIVWTGRGVADVVGMLGQTSLSLSLQAAAPVLAAGMIVSWGLASLSGAGGSPQATTLIGLPVRIVMSLGILAVCLSGAGDALLNCIDRVLDQFPQLVSC